MENQLTQSKCFTEFAKALNNPRVLEAPEEFLGDNWKSILQFWNYLDSLSDNDLENIAERFLNLPKFSKTFSFKLCFDDNLLETITGLSCENLMLIRLCSIPCYIKLSHHVNTVISLALCELLVKNKLNDPSLETETLTFLSLFDFDLDLNK